MDEDEDADNIIPYEKDIARMIVQDPYLSKMLESQSIRNHEEAYIQDMQTMGEHLPPSALSAPVLQDSAVKPVQDKKETAKSIKYENRRNFALTPLDKGYFDMYSKSNDYGR